MEHEMDLQNLFHMYKQVFPVQEQFLLFNEWNTSLFTFEFQFLFK